MQKENIIDILKARGFVKQVVFEDELYKTLGEKPCSFYIGFDPTADSLHVGHFMQLIVMSHMQKAGHRPIILIGGGTAMIGDPSGRTDMRQMMTKETIAHNVECFKKQMSRLIDFSDDKAIIGGIARFHGKPVTVIVQAKGTNTRENIERNFGMPSPDGYRKALRLMKQAEKFGRPVICFVDTPGAFCGLEAEERGQGEAIARNIYEMSGLTVPVLSIIIGEGGSGGALAMATADQVWMLENSIYSILSPEGFASILWKDSSRAKEAAEVMRLTAQDLYEMGMVEKVFPEPAHYTVQNLKEVTGPMEQEIERFLEESAHFTGEELAARRYDRFRNM